jgi:alkylated DNA repair dioxygenase AlkB
MSSPTSTAADAFRRLDLPDAEVCYWPEAFVEPEASQRFSELRNDIEWRGEEVVVFCRRHPVPRLVAWHGDAGARYTYSGTPHEPSPWTPALERIRERVQALADCEFNSVLLNLYRDGRDGMGWHADDEPELGPDPVIAAVSLGAARRFCLRHRRHRGTRLDLALGQGSLLLMSGATQRHWVHSVPKTVVPVGERINLTFRSVMFT